MCRISQLALASSLAHLAIASVSSAFITGVGGANTVWLTTPPAISASLSGPKAYVWNENQNVGVGTVPVNISANPTTATGSTWYLSSATGPFNSHMIHFAPTGPGANVGSATFNGKILGVIFAGLWLGASDAIFGNPSTVYPSFAWGRSFATGQLWSSSLTINNNTISWSLNPLNAAQYGADVRVLTVVPSPSSLGLLACGSLFGVRRRRCA
ncbi:MAG: hypothetical protein SFY96_02305 [Planctomycetota bacterium]|nr:hypothetical protein [Planctomycetota bacterium]